MLRERVITALVLAALVLLVIFWLPHVGDDGCAGAAGDRRRLGMVGVSALHAAFSQGALCSCRGCVRRGRLVVRRRSATRSDRLIHAALLWWVFALIWVAIAPARVNRTTAAGAGLLVLVPAWLALARLHALGPELLLFLILLVVAADVGAYFAGRSFGRNKLAPRVSPGKTWEGVLGGFAAARGDGGHRRVVVPGRRAALRLRCASSSWWLRSSATSPKACSSGTRA